MNKWGVQRLFRGNANCAKHQRNVTNHIGTHGNVSGDNITRSGEVQ